MYLNNPDLLNALAKEKLADLRQEAALHRRLLPLKSNYRLRLARSLQRLASWLEPEKEAQHALR